MAWLEVVDLPVRERVSFFRSAVAQRVAGGRLYDAHIAAIARSCGASVIVTEYVRRVRSNTGPTWNARQNVLDAIRLDGNGTNSAFAGEAVGSRYDIASEMAETAWEMGIPAPDVDGEPDEHDAYMDMLFDMLPAVETALKGTN